MIYRLFFKLVLQRLDAETAHKLASRVLPAVTAMPLVGAMLRRVLVPRNERLSIKALGLKFPSPLGVAAGVDKDASWFESLGAIGFGFVEVGTVTAEPQEGNPRPRVRRLSADRALINRMGFPNPGATDVATRLRTRTGNTITGVNIGKSEAVPMDRAVDDYRAAARHLAPYADYMVVNVSSPNTPGVRELQVTTRLRPLIVAIREELAATSRVPLLVKIGPDLSNDDLDAVADVCAKAGVDGIIATNTTIGREGLVGSADAARPFGSGGLSGPPLQARSLEVLRRLSARVGDELVLISVGGIETPADAWERILEGASLVQAHTGFIFGGPLWPRRMNRAIARYVRDAGWNSIQDAVGTAAKQSKASGAVKGPPGAPGLIRVPESIGSRSTRVA